ncbi:MAG TPA: hypothetical protein VGP43_01540 [Chitinophagaceae bacterium]|nr:hypothetical protein [Chitinophagaceae bacterium]
MKKETSNQKKGVTQIDKKGNQSIKKTSKKSSALLAASKGRSAVDNVKAASGKDVRGSSGLANTGPFVSYED